MPIPLPVIPNVMRTALKWSHSSGQTAVNVIHFRTPSPGTGVAALFESLQDNMTAAMFDQLSSGASISSIDITPLNGTAATSSFVTGSPANMSGGSGGVIAPAVSVLVKLQTGLRGRNKRGRIFLPMMIGAAADNGFLAPAEVASMTAAWQAFVTAMAADPDGPYELVVAAYDRRHGGVGAGSTDVTTISVESPLGTQRRRQGRNRGA